MNLYCILTSLFLQSKIESKHSSKKEKKEKISLWESLIILAGTIPAIMLAGIKKKD